eukprot:GHVO01070060.1.p1 GENE.GHVO01070060.1~~GHVO01070060.1.p1  ORF type:complete len:190 (+),score=38.85 GHVO01070060.1:97-666(+)
MWGVWYTRCTCLIRSETTVTTKKPWRYMRTTDSDADDFQPPKDYERSYGDQDTLYGPSPPEYPRLPKTPAAPVDGPIVGVNVPSKGLAVKYVHSHGSQSRHDERAKDVIFGKPETTTTTEAPTPPVVAEAVEETTTEAPVETEPARGAPPLADIAKDVEIVEAGGAHGLLSFSNMFVCCCALLVYVLEF